MYQESKDLFISDFCPYISQNLMTIATYTKFSPIGDTRDYAVLAQFHCDCSTKCGIKDIENECPLYEIAEQKKLW